MAQTGSDFALRYLKSTQPGWEEGAVQAALAGDVVMSPLIEVPLSIPALYPSVKGHTGSVFVSSDVFSVGTPANFLRLPLSPIPAQRIANILGNFLLPTRKLAQDIYKAATVKVSPLPLSNKGPNLAQYADHSVKVQAQIDAVSKASANQLIGGHKKDVVIWGGLRPGQVAIYGWFNTDGSRIQPLHDGHDDHYADYSHGIRFVSPDMILDGKPAKLEALLKDPKLAVLVSDEGPLKNVRYSVPKGVSGGNPPPLMSGPPVDGGLPSAPGNAAIDAGHVASLAKMGRYTLGWQILLSWARS